MIDILIKNAKIADGSGDVAYYGNITIQDGLITAIIRSDGEEGNVVNQIQAKKTVDCRNQLVAAPGFIDTHGHENFYVFYDSAITPKLLQGITTIIHGNCGYSPCPINFETFEILKEYDPGWQQRIPMLPEWSKMDTFHRYLEAVENIKPIINFGSFVGHGSIRIASMGVDDRKPSLEELEQMKAYLREAMISGAYGMSSGLLYAPGSFADTHELIELCKVVAEYDGIYSTHMRDEAKGILDSIREAIEIGRESGVKVLISHLKVATFAYMDYLPEVFELIDRAKLDGIQIGVDQYPYNTGATLLTALLPGKYMTGGNSQLLEWLKNKKIRQQMKREICDVSIQWDNCIMESGFENISVLSVPVSAGAVGKTIEALAVELKKDPFDVLFDLIVDNGGQGMCSMVYTEDDCVDQIFQHPLTMVGSDGNLDPSSQIVHPRSYAAFPRVLGRLVREKKLVTTEEAIRKMTAAPADYFCLKNKGFVREGYDADLVIFDPEKVMDHADFKNQTIPNEGILHVVLGGELAVYDGEKLTGAGKGKVLRAR